MDTMEEYARHGWECATHGERLSVCGCVVMDTMTYYLSEAMTTARHLVATVEKSSGVCESCMKDSPVTFYIGTAFECAGCFYDSVTYWERREGTTSEAIWDGSPFPVDEFKWGGKEHRRIIARHHATLVIALEEESKR